MEIVEHDRHRAPEASEIVEQRPRGGRGGDVAFGKIRAERAAESPAKTTQRGNEVPEEHREIGVLWPEAVLHRARRVAFGKARQEGGFSITRAGREQGEWMLWNAVYEAVDQPRSREHILMTRAYQLGAHNEG